MSQALTDRPDQPLVSLVIVHYRTPDLLARCLSQITEARIEIPYEVIVVDNDPVDHRAAELADQYGIRFIRNERNLGYGRAVNQAMAAAHGRYYMILNPDVEVGAGSIETLASYLDDHPAVGMCGPKLFSTDGTLQYSARTFYTLKIILLRRTPLGRLFPNSKTVSDHLMMDWDHNDTREVDWMLGGALMVRSEAIKDVGGMDDRFFLYFEDVDWCNRMKRRGWRVVYVPSATMVHAHQRASSRGFLSPGKRMHIESALRFYEKWSLIIYIWKRQSTAIRGFVTLLSDFVLLSIAFFLAYYTRYLLGTLIPDWSAVKPVLGLGVYTRFILFADLVAIGTFYFLGLYRGEIWRDRWREFFQLIKGSSITSLMVMASTFLFTTRPMSRFTILLFFVYGLLLVSTGRMTIRHLVKGARDHKLHLRRLAIFASADRIAELKRRFHLHGTFGYEPIYLSHEDEAAGHYPPGIDPVDRRMRMIEDERIAEAVVFESPEHNHLLDSLVPKLMAGTVPVVYIPRSDSIFLEANRLRDFMGFGSISFGRRSNAVASGLKLAVDRVLACLLIVIGSPIHFAQLLISGKGCVDQLPLIGKRGERFGLKLYRENHGPAAGWQLFRLYPALLNILSGELSFVGQTPLTIEQWEAVEKSYRLNPPDARPGLAAEVQGASGFCRGTRSGQPGDMDLLKMIVALNRRYNKIWSMSEDMRILLETIQEKKDQGGGEA